MSILPTTILIAANALPGRSPRLAADKGMRGGSCNREACQSPGANWFNHYTDKYYCQDCAHLINRANPEGWPIGSGNPAVVYKP